MAAAALLLLPVSPMTTADREKLARGLRKLMAEDPTIHVTADPDSGDVILGGIGERHLEIVLDRLRRRFEVAARVGRPQIAYKETVTHPADGETKFAEQGGGGGQYGHVKIHLTPGARGSGYAFENAILGGAIPTRFIGAIAEGIKDALARGVLAAYPMDDVRVELYDGSYHDVDSSDGAFRIAGALAFQDAAKKAGPVLLEPVMRVQVVAPAPQAASIKQDLLSRRALELTHSERSGTTTITVRVPLAEMFGYSIWLRDVTIGRGAFDMRFERYERVGHDGRGDDLQPIPVAPTRPGPTLGPLKAEAAEPEEDGASERGA